MTHTQIPDRTLDCTELTAHTHPREFYASVRRQSLEFGWWHDDEYIDLHENPDARDAFETEWGEKPSLRYFEDFAHQMRGLEYRAAKAEEEAELRAVGPSPSWDELHPAEQAFLREVCGDRVSEAWAEWIARG